MSIPFHHSVFLFLQVPNSDLVWAQDNRHTMNLGGCCHDVHSTTTFCHKGNEISSGKMIIYPISFNKTNCDHLIYKPQDTHKVFKNITLKRFKTEIWVTFLSLCQKVRIGFTRSRRLNASKSDFLQMLWDLLEGLL